MDDLYKRLGVSRKATDKEIKSAYRRLARDKHPDVSRSPDSAAEFARIHEAYRILSDPEKRACYDRGEEVSSKSVGFYSSQRQQVVQYQRKINKIVDDMIEEERAETRIRAQVVSVVVTLFLSTFVVALAKPLFFDPFNLPVALSVGAVSLVGLLYLVRALRMALEHYTYTPPPPSVTHEPERPRQPFSRGEAVAFLAGGYLISLLAGALLDMLSGGAIGGGLVGGHAILGVFIYPPIAVLIVDNMRRLGAAIDGQ